MCSISCVYMCVYIYTCILELSREDEQDSVQPVFMHVHVCVCARIRMYFTQYMLIHTVQKENILYLHVVESACTFDMFH
jgi:hypothetical protein